MLATGITTEHWKEKQNAPYAIRPTAIAAIVSEILKDEKNLEGDKDQLKMGSRDRDKDHGLSRLLAGEYGPSSFPD